MLIPKGYALSNEIAKNGNIHIANMSMLVKELENKNITGAFIKYGGCTFINTKSLNLPKYIYKAIHSGELTDLSDCILLSTFREELGCSEKDALSIPDASLVRVEGKKFIKFPSEFIEKLKGKVITSISEKDYLEEDVDGIRLSKRMFMVWY